MKSVNSGSSVGMIEFNNSLVALIDGSDLGVLEIITVLDITITRIKQMLTVELTAVAKDGS